MEGVHRPADTPHTFRVRLLSLKSAKMAKILGSFSNSEDPEDSHLCWGGETGFCNTSGSTGPHCPPPIQALKFQLPERQGMPVPGHNILTELMKFKQWCQMAVIQPYCCSSGKRGLGHTEIWGYTEKKDHVRTWWDEVIGKSGGRGPRRDQTCWLLALGLEPAKW